MNQQLLGDFRVFAAAQLASGDIDPTYPVLAKVYRQRGYDADTALWHTLLYVAFYNLGSAEEVFNAFPAYQHITAPLTKTTGIERRGFRGNTLANDHINAMVALWKAAGGPSKWVQGVIGRGGEQGWKKLRLAFQQVPHGGNWSSYKWADLLKNVHHLPITADDIGVGGGGPTAGPVPGMVRLTNKPWKECAENVLLQRQLMLDCVSKGVPFDGLDQLETALCDFNSLCKGTYYVGHDIDQQMDQLANLGPEWWAARQQVFPRQYLGELNGWNGVRKELKTKYAQEGVVLT